MLEVEVSNAHAIEIMEFLGKPAGKTLVQALYSRRPDITGTNMEAKAMSGSVAEGWEKCIEEIVAISLARPAAEDFHKDKYINPSDDDNPNKRPTGKV
jgi:hypothetical protein